VVDVERDARGVFYTDAQDELREGGLELQQ
jgi:hypothetical protein